MISLVWAGSGSPGLRDGIAEWCAAQIWPDNPKPFGDCVCVGAFEQGEIIGAVVFTNYDPDALTIEFSMASTSRRWLTRRLMEEMRIYCIDQLGMQLVMARTKASNTSIRKMMKAYGFSEYVIPRLFGRDEDGVIFTITSEQVRNSRIGKRSRDGRS